METQNLTFEQLPGAISELCAKIERIEQILSNSALPDSSTDEIITIDEACKILNLAKQSVYGKVFRNEIPFIKPAGSKRLFFSKTELLEYLNSGRKSIAIETSIRPESHILKNRR